MANLAPNVKTIQTSVDNLGAAVDNTPVVEKAPITGSVSAVTYTPNAAMTGDSTNGRTLNLINKGPTGAGSTVIATLAFVTGVNLVADVEKTITLSATPANLAVTKGDILALQSVHTGTGVADPGGIVSIDITGPVESAFGAGRIAQL